MIICPFQWKISLKIINSGITLKTFTYALMNKTFITNKIQCCSKYMNAENNQHDSLNAKFFTFSIQQMFMSWDKVALQYRIFC